LRRRFARFAVAKGRRGICSVCTHAQRREIELATVTLVPVLAIAVRYGISRDSVYRHAKKHLTAVQRAAYLSAMKPVGVDLEQLQRSEGESLLAQLLAGRAKLQMYSAAAFEAGQLATAVSAEKGVVENLGLVSKLLGMLVTRHEVSHTSLLVSPSYLELRETLLRVLRKHPAAARDVAAALHELESRAAEQIKAAKNSRPTLTIEHQPEAAP
jgi:hypothetical protein